MDCAVVKEKRNHTEAAAPQQQQQQHHHHHEEETDAALLPQKQKQQQEQPCMVSWNVSSGNREMDYAAVAQLLYLLNEKGTPADVIALQETLSLPDSWKKKVPSIDENYEGVNTGTESAIFYNKNKYDGMKFDHTEGRDYDVNNGNSFEMMWRKRTCIAILTPKSSHNKTKEAPIVVISWHAPLGKLQAKEFFEKASQLRDRHFSKCAVYVGGDFNFDLKEHIGNGHSEDLHRFTLLPIKGDKYRTKKEIDYVLYRSAEETKGDSAAAAPVSAERLPISMEGRSTTHLPLVVYFAAPSSSAAAAADNNTQAPTEAVLHNPTFPPLTDLPQPIKKKATGSPAREKSPSPPAAAAAPAGTVATEEAAEPERSTVAYKDAPVHTQTSGSAASTEKALPRPPSPPAAVPADGGGRAAPPPAGRADVRPFLPSETPAQDTNPKHEGRPVGIFTGGGAACGRTVYVDSKGVWYTLSLKKNKMKLP